MQRILPNEFLRVSRGPHGHGAEDGTARAAVVQLLKDSGPDTLLGLVEQRGGGNWVRAYRLVR